MRRPLVLLVVLGLFVTGCGSHGSSSSTARSTSTAPVSTSAKIATAELSQLAVKPLASMVGYSRDQFGPAWADVDHNHCDTRNDILRRDLTQIVLEPGSTCVVERGTLHDPYTGKTIFFVRGPNSSAIQIDHLVALGDAWRTGATGWSAARREQYANDPAVLLAVDGPANEAKGDADASQWLPPNRSYDCSYVVKQIAVKMKYRLWVTQGERGAIENVLAGCSQAS
ncbi:MAG: HNH endonuclease family protein [Gaiellaceae bacterium]